MRLIKSHLFALMVLMLSCNQQEKTTIDLKSDWPAKGIAYEIFVQSFYDANGDGIGDIPGMTKKLDYLKDLGVDAVWLMPIMPSPSYHKYDVTDYRDIHPDYGTLKDFKSFVRQAHEHGIRVIIDFIINHSSSNHPWFLDAKSGPNSKYRDYYVWANKDSVAKQIAKKEISFDSDNIRQWHAVDGDSIAEHYYGFFNGGMPDLDFDNLELRKEIFDIGKYWLQEVGVDGFRMDAAKHIYPDDRVKDSHAFWKEFKNEMQTVKPDVYIVGEVWSNTTFQSPFVSGFSSLFNFDLAFSILETVNKEKPISATISGHGWLIDSTHSFVDDIIQNTEIYKKVNPAYTDAIFLTNHDQNRALSVLGNSEVKAKLAASIMMTLPGTPYIYYGEEIGMKGMKPDEYIREPFLWSNHEDSGRPKWISPRYSTDSTVVALQLQLQDDTSIFNHYKKLIKLRKENPILSIGEIAAYQNENNGLLMFKRVLDKQVVLVIHNLTGETQTVSLPNIKSIIGGIPSKLTGDELTISGYQSAVVEIE